ncbi:MAG TPA: hypothetical protein VKT32_00295 [Chthonomonadaceae bacterium]|nr:hypothetical protein [Chthonomonadaceae bacterium]
MERRELLRLLGGLAAISLTGSGSIGSARAGQKAASAMYARCAQVCDECMRACSACSRHCAAMLAAGHKEHERTKRLSDDNRDICATAARICARRGPMTAAICEACATACDTCGAACSKYPDMKPMKDCAQSCIACARACREMVAALKG